MLNEINLENILFFDTEFDVLQDQQEILNKITQNLTTDQKQELDHLLSFVVNRTEAHYNK